MEELNQRDREILEVMTEGRANPYLIRERTEYEKGDVNTALVSLGRRGFVRQVTRGLYEITERGRDALGDVTED